MLTLLLASLLLVPLVVVGVVLVAPLFVLVTLAWHAAGDPAAVNDHTVACMVASIGGSDTPCGVPESFGFAVECERLVK